MKSVHEMALIDHTHWSHVSRRTQTIRYWCICRLKVTFTTTDRLLQHLIFYSVLFCILFCWFVESSAASWTFVQHLHANSCCLCVSFTVQMRRLMHKKDHLQRKQTFHGLSCRNNVLVHNNSVYFACDDGHSPMRLKLSDKVLLNFFILPIFSAGWAAGIKSHMSLKSGSKWDA